MVSLFAVPGAFLAKNPIRHDKPVPACRVGIEEKGRAGPGMECVETGEIRCQNVLIRVAQPVENKHRRLVIEHPAQLGSYVSHHLGAVYLRDDERRVVHERVGQITTVEDLHRRHDRVDAGSEVHQVEEGLARYHLNRDPRRRGSLPDLGNGPLPDNRATRDRIDRRLL